MNRVSLGNLELDRDRFDVRIDSHRVELTFTEFALLDELAQHAGRVVGQAHLLRAGWGDESPKLSGRLRVQISRLRKKLHGSRPWAIRTVKRRGYALVDVSEDRHPRSAPGQGSQRLEPSRGVGAL